MVNKDRAFIYLSNKHYDGTVYQTQILDWLSLYNREGISFSLYQIFHIKDIRRMGFCRMQVRTIRSHADNFKGSMFFFPSKGIYAFINALLLFIKLYRSIRAHKEILIFSRGIIGKEIHWLKRISRKKVVFYFDARAASAEENKYAAIKNSVFSLWKYQKIAHITYTEYSSLKEADKILTVSHGLASYFNVNYKIPEEKFVYYPCLSDHSKFYYDAALRGKMRAELNIPDEHLVILYSGGLSEEWHVAEDMFRFFESLRLKKVNLVFLILTRDEKGLARYREQYPELSRQIIATSAPNEEVFSYLNAADYGVLFREDTLMNNVASPSKFAEYILCGLPVIISEGVGDYAKFTKENNTGVILSQDDLKHPDHVDFDSIFKNQFNREELAIKGKDHLSKEALLPSLVRVFTEHLT